MNNFNKFVIFDDFLLDALQFLSDREIETEGDRERERHRQTERDARRESV